MHLDKILLLNSGPIEKAALALPFHADGRPKPVLIVGGNGAGKTNILSVIADAIMEIAATEFIDVLPPRGLGHSYYRIVGGSTTRTGAAYSLAALRFKHTDQFAFYRTVSGTAPFSDLRVELSDFGGLNADNKDTEGKLTNVPGDLVKSVFKAGAYVYFPSSRHELPHWLNEPTLDADPQPQILSNYTDKLGKPIVLDRGMHLLKPWIIDVLLDQSVDAASVQQMLSSNPPAFNAAYSFALDQSKTTVDLVQLLRVILAKQDARIVRAPRTAADRRLQVYFGTSPGLPTFDNMSAGQATLFNVFASTLMFGTAKATVATAASATGIVLVDEIDAHLHSDLQYEALPRLMAMFPGVQFIVTSHSPLLPLGMRRQFGDDGYVLVEMPTASPISAERYSEFLRSFEMYQSTRTFEERLKALAISGKPIVFGEGQTDPIYLSTAAELLGYTDLVESVEFRSIGEIDPTGKQTNGQDQLKKAADIYKATLPLLARRVVCLFDQKSEKQIKVTPFTADKLAIRVLPLVPDHEHCNDGPENLLPPELFVDEFYADKNELTGTTKRTVRTLDKVRFADHVCKQLRNPEHFARFRPILDDLRSFLLSKPLSADGGGVHSADPQPDRVLQEADEGAPS